MGNDVKTVDQNPVSGSQVQPSASVGLANKEIGPIPSAIPELRPAGTEVQHKISQESTELGVKEIQDRPDLTQVVDMRHAGPHVPVSTTPLNSIQYPMSEEEVAEKLKTGQDDDSGKWLSKLIQKIMKVMGLKIS